MGDSSENHQYLFALLDRWHLARYRALLEVLRSSINENELFSSFAKYLKGKSKDVKTFSRNSSASLLAETGRVKGILSLKRLCDVEELLFKRN